MLINLKCYLCDEELIQTKKLDNVENLKRELTSGRIVNVCSNCDLIYENSIKVYESQKVL